MREQQDKLYAAERRATFGLGIAEDRLQSYVDDLRDTDYWQRNFPMVRSIRALLELSRKRSVATCNGDGDGEIEMAGHDMYERVVLHEVAHVVASARYGSRSHDPWFCRTYLELVFTFMGPAAYAELKQAFVEDGIEHDTDNAVPGGIAL